ncbi:hypothetical protein Hanom_Chr03g00211581 [Helianthus anomalus]
MRNTPSGVSAGGILGVLHVRPPVDELMNVVYMLFDGLERGTSTVSVVTRRIL